MSRQLASDASSLLFPALRRLDRRIEHALAIGPDVLGQSFEEESNRGLCIDGSEIDRLLERSLGEPLFAQADDASNDEAAGQQTNRLRALFKLTDFDVDVLAIALAPEVDLRYERIYAYLQDDVTRKRPTVDLALNLLCATAGEKLERRAHFRLGSPLLRHGLVDLISDSTGPATPLLARTIQIDERLVDALTGEEALDPRLANCCELVRGGAGWESLPMTLETRRTLPSLTLSAWDDGTPLRFYFHGESHAGKRTSARALAKAIGVPLLIADLHCTAESNPAAAKTIQRVFREAVLLDGLLYITGFDTQAAASAAHQAVITELERHRRPVIIAGANRWVSLANPELVVIAVEFSIPEFDVRRDCWNQRLADHSWALDPRDGDDLAARFRLTAAQIGDAVESAVQQARWHSAVDESAGSTQERSVDHLYAAARAQCGHDLARLAKKITPHYGWDDIVLPEEQIEQLHEVCEQARHRQTVFGAWGFGRKLSIGKGLNVLFAGPPGTGKTMAAEVLARELRLDLYKIDLSQVVNKYIGETEKNLDRIFSTAENSNAILFFDEADALFGRRSEVRDSHDRYANIEISYLLQKMEEYEGISVLATNLRQNVDDAFTRRLQAIVEFPFPNAEDRRRIWEVTFPLEAPVGDDVDFAALGREVALAGGSMKNMAIAASCLAASGGGSIAMQHVLNAAVREFQKLGREWAPPACLAVPAGDARASRPGLATP